MLRLTHTETSRERIERVRRGIKDGTYDTVEKLASAAGLMLASQMERLATRVPAAAARPAGLRIARGGR